MTPSQQELDHGEVFLVKAEVLLEVLPRHLSVAILICDCGQQIYLAKA